MAGLCGSAMGEFVRARTHGSIARPQHSAIHERLVVSSNSAAGREGCDSLMPQRGPLVASGRWTSLFTEDIQVARWVAPSGFTGEGAQRNRSRTFRGKKYDPYRGP